MKNVGDKEVMKTMKDINYTKLFFEKLKKQPKKVYFQNKLKQYQSNTKTHGMS